MGRTKPISITLDPKNLKVLDEISDCLGIPSRSETVRHLIRNAYEKKNR